MKTLSPEREIIVDGRHTDEVQKVLGADLTQDSLAAIRSKATKVIQLCVDPISGPPPQPSDGLLYGLIQSGKTSIITVAAAMAADNGFQCIVILTSDIDLLYEQTLERIRKALRGLSVLGKNDWRDAARFGRQLRTPPFVIVCSKNGNKLSGLLNAFQAAKARGLSLLLIDDEADQASLNTQTSAGTGQFSRINRVITDLRNYFPVNTYLQVTATPQALFLQRPDHRYRPTFSVLSEPGMGYIGGEAFFGPDSDNLLRIVDLAEVNQLRATNQPSPTGTVPAGLKKALYTFLVGASARVLVRPPDGFAFLCHVSMNRNDHAQIVGLIDRFKEDTINAVQKPASQKYNVLLRDLRASYDDLAKTEPSLPAFEKIIETIAFYIQGANIKLVNATSNDEIKLDAVFNLFVGGNKLGRGVTIKNLLVSYYGRNPRRPNADTVLQHARMYGYRQRDLGVTRLFLPQQLANHFRSIHQMETALRDLLTEYPDGRFEGIYVSNPLHATRRNVLDPTSLGFYVAGGSYNTVYPLRTPAARPNTLWLDDQLAGIADDGTYVEVQSSRIIELIEKCVPDPQYGSQLWNVKTLRASLETLKSLRGDRAYLVVRRNRNLTQPRRETQGILAGGEDALAPRDNPTLFLFRQNATVSGEEQVWWPQIRFPDGNYVLAFSFDW